MTPGKKKIATFLLLLVVIAVWSKIGYDIYSNASEKGHHQIEISSGYVAGLKEVTQIQDSLILDYKDPFLKSFGSKRASQLAEHPAMSIKTERAPKAKKQVDKAVVWPAFVYNGQMRSSGQKEALALLSTGEKQYVVPEGDYVLECLIKKVYPDSVILAMGNQSKTIKK